MWAVACGGFLAGIEGMSLARAETRASAPEDKKIRKWIREIEKDGHEASETPASQRP